MKRALITLVLLLLAAAAVGKFFVFEVPTISGNEMAPTLQAGDRLLAYRLNTKPARGDLVLFEHPTEGRLMIRRVVAVPGDRVAVRAEVPEINGKPVARKVVREVTLSDLLDGRRQELAMKLVEETLGDRSYLLLKDPRRRSKDFAQQELTGAYFVLADSRNHGLDSRNFGSVPSSRIRAVVSRRISAGPGSLLGEGPRKGWTELR
jgi:signal peptidase I